MPAVAIPSQATIVVTTVDGPPPLVGLRKDVVFADAATTGSPPRAAADAGCCLVESLEIRAVQAAIEFRTITGVEADVEMLREALDEYLS
jgi:hypothetical protein